MHGVLQLVSWYDNEWCAPGGAAFQLFPAYGLGPTLLTTHCGVCLSVSWIAMPEGLL